MNKFAKRLVAKTIKVDVPDSRFIDGEDAVGYTYAIKYLLEGKALKRWAQAVDAERGPGSLGKLQLAIRVYNEFLESLEEE